LAGLFWVEEVRKYLCAIHHQSTQKNWRNLFVINIFKVMFEANNITPVNVSVLLKNWFLFGLIGLSELKCKTFVEEPEPTIRFQRNWR
jgi:hypothetical protein